MKGRVGKGVKRRGNGEGSKRGRTRKEVNGRKGEVMKRIGETMKGRMRGGVRNGD